MRPYSYLDIGHNYNNENALVTIYWVEGDRIFVQKDCSPSEGHSCLEVDGRCPGFGMQAGGRIEQDTEIGSISLHAQSATEAERILDMIVRKFPNVKFYVLSDIAHNMCPLEEYYESLGVLV